MMTFGIVLCATISFDLPRIRKEATDAMADQVDAETPASPIHVLLGKSTLLARVVAFVGSVDTRVLGGWRIR